MYFQLSSDLTPYIGISTELNSLGAHVQQLT